MITLRNRTVLTVAAFMLGAVQSFANETCAANVNECTPLQLCEASTSIVNDQKVWSLDPVFADHVATSQQLGINCGVVEVVQPNCETDANLCTVTALCEQATQLSASGTSRSWSAENAAHARLARQFGLTCGVGEIAAAQPSVAEAVQATCETDASRCDNADLCELGTRVSASGTTRSWSAENAAHARLARQLGLTCGVGEAVASQPSNATADEELCARATFVLGSSIKWRGGSLRRQAQERGLTCNVGMTVGDQAILGSPSASNDDQVCTRSTHRRYPGTVIWDSDAWSAAWRNEAERRGLTCGVVENAESQENQISDADLCARATFDDDGRITWRSTLRRRQAEERGLTCGVGGAVAAQSASVAEEPPCPANGNYFNGCYGPWTNREGDTLVGSWDDGSLQGVATLIYGPGEWQGDVQIGMTSYGRITGGQALYIWRSGHARFEWSWDDAQSYSSNSNVNDVFPSLKRMFQDLPREQRLTIQRSLARKGLYGSTIDGVWGRNTLISIARFTGEHLSTVNLRSTENVIIVLDAIRAQANLDRTARASSNVLQAVAERDEVAATAATNSVNFRQAFTSQTLLRRQQLQYALRELGFYSSSVDGLWGNGTSSAIVSFVEANGGTGRDAERIFRDILSRVDVPSSFAAPRPLTTSNGVASTVARIEQICRRRADQARRVARNNHRPSNTSTSAFCRRDFFGNYDCSTSTGLTGGFWGGMLAAVEADNAGRDAYDIEYETCMIQLGN